jgi:hypothetical protein
MSESIVYADASKTSNDQIIEILKNEAGLNPAADTSRDELIQLCKDNDIKVDETKAKKAKKVTKADDEDGDEEPPAKKEPVAYIINVQGNKDTKEIIIGVNGIHTQILCDVDVRVTPGMLESIRNAKQDIIEFIPDPTGMNSAEQITRAIPVYPFSIVEAIYE